MDDRVYQFGEIRVDAGRFQVLRSGVPVDLEPKALEVLLFLIERRDRMVLKDELLEGVWRDTFVTPNALTRVIAQLRKALGDDAQEARVIETVPRKGYRFLPEVVPGPPARGLPAAAAPPSAAHPRAVPAPPSFLRVSLPLLAGAFLALTGWTWLRPPAPAPLGLTDLAQLTTGDGYEADPAISPDGRRLAYTSEENGFNEIFVRPLGDGNRIKVTSDGGQNIEPAWSPDGEHLAYHSVTRGGIWIVPASGGEPRQVAELGSEPAWSPDGSTIAFSTYQGALAERAGIVRVAVAGGSAQPVTRPGSPRGGHRKPAWSRDGRRVAFSSFDGSEGPSVWVVQVAGGDPVRVAAGGMPTGLAFTPDDRAVCWSGTGPSVNVGLWCASPDPTDPKTPIAVLQGVAGAAGLSIARDGTLAYAVRRTESDLWSLPLADAGQPSGAPAPMMRDTSRNSYPSFSPDGRHLAYLTWRPGSPSDLWLMNLQTQAAAVVTSAKDDEFFPSWMPDSRRILVAVGAGPVRRMVRVAIDTRQTEDVQGLPAQMANLALSPDGRRLAYHLADDSGGLTAWLVPAGGGQPERLSPPEHSAGYPAWSPDGRRIALEVEDRGDTQVWVINADGTGFRQLTKGSGQHWPHSWAPDNDRIVFAGERGGVWNVWAVSASTGVAQQLTSFSTPNGYVRYPAWSPRNDRIVFEHATVTANVWTARLTGGTARRQ
jgi:Tol biopolymer transport system component/DNA-binding winged helix-turn-helix (wHTH) protein